MDVEFSFCRLSSDDLRNQLDYTGYRDGVYYHAAREETSSSGGVVGGYRPDHRVTSKVSCWVDTNTMHGMSRCTQVLPETTACNRRKPGHDPDSYSPYFWTIDDSGCGSVSNALTLKAPPTTKVTRQQYDRSRGHGKNIDKGVTFLSMPYHRLRSSLSLRSVCPHHN